MTISWDEYFLSIAKAVSRRSSCSRANVGAVLVSSEKKIKATGYNSPPHGVTDCQVLGFCNKDRLGYESGTGYEHCPAIHAEQNALIQAGEILCRGSSLYIWGHEFVCSFCKRLILQSGIKYVFLQKDENASIETIEPKNWIKELSSSTDYPNEK